MTPFEKAVEAMFHAENGIDGDSVGDMVFEDFRISGTAEEAIKTSKAVLARALTAALSALESEGWVLVPVEPTEAMLSAMTRHNADWLSDKGPYPRSRRVYSAMLSARPKAPQQEGE